MLNSPFKKGLSLTLTILLTACGGGGSGSEKNTMPAVTRTLSLSPASIQFASHDQAAQFDIVTTGSWSLMTSANWLSVSPLSGTNNESITVSASNNTQTTMRESAITITAGTVTKNLPVVQEAFDDATGIPADNSGMRDIASVAFTQLLGYGINIGNSLEAVGGETAWGNPLINQALLDGIKAAGFNSIRLPVAWSQFTDSDNYVIDEVWLNRVEQVVNYAYNNDMYVIMNMHWDGGWMQPTYAKQVEVNRRIKLMWRQIATHFRDFDDHLLFAGTNEVMVEDDFATPTSEYYTVQNSFNQTFVDVVRATGGRNAFRHLVVQGFNTNIDHTLNFAVLPTDSVSQRLMMEVHYYDPYNFTLNENSSITQWGVNATEPDKTETWADESYVDSQFTKMKTRYIDNGVGVLLGEFAAMSRTDVVGHESFRLDWDRYITQSAVTLGLVPYYWDAGFTGNHGSGVFNRVNGNQIYPEVILAITGQ